MNRFLIAVSVLAVSFPAFAGKEDRDYMTKEVIPAAKAAEAKWKSSCGCVLTIKIDDASLKSKDDMPAARNFCKSITEEIGAYCNDESSKKAMCAMKSLIVKKADDATFTFKGGVGTATVYGITAPSFEMVTREIDK
jgi:hypothetical protein